MRPYLSSPGGTFYWFLRLFTVSSSFFFFLPPVFPAQCPTQVQRLEREKLMRRLCSGESRSVDGILAHRERCQALSGSFSAWWLWLPLSPRLRTWPGPFWRILALKLKTCPTKVRSLLGITTPTSPTRMPKKWWVRMLPLSMHCFFQVRWLPIRLQKEN